MKEIQEFLENQGFKRFNSVFDPESVCYQKRVDDGVNYLCSSNDKLFLNVYITEVSISTDRVHRAAKINLCHADTYSQWFELDAYGISFDDFIPSFERNVNKLMSAWKAVYTGGRNDTANVLTQSDT